MKTQPRLRSFLCPNGKRKPCAQLLRILKLPTLNPKPYNLQGRTCRFCWQSVHLVNLKLAIPGPPERLGFVHLGEGREFRGFGGFGLPRVSIVVPFFWFNQFYIEDPKRSPQKGTAMETTGRTQEGLRCGLDDPSAVRPLPRDILFPFTSSTATPAASRPHTPGPLLDVSGDFGLQRLLQVAHPLWRHVLLMAAMDNFNEAPIPAKHQSQLGLSSSFLGSKL